MSMPSGCKQILSRLEHLVRPVSESESFPPRWSYYDTMDEASSTVELRDIESILIVLRCMKAEWRKERLEVPAAWVPSVSPLQTLCPFIPDYSIGFMTAPIQSKLHPLTNEQLVDRHDHISIRPDFCLSSYRIPTIYAQVIGDGYNGLSAWQLQAPCSTVVGDLMMYYTGQESVADYAISGPFVGIPGCWLTRATNSYLPASLAGPAPALELEFAVLPHPRRSSSPADIVRDASLKITLAHPAILLAMKGPAPWAESFQHPTALRDVVHALSLHAQSSLQALRLTWRFRHEDATSLAPLPNDAIIFGLIYDSRKVHLVAHFWGSDTDLISVVVDTLDFPSDVDPDTVDFPAWSENRVRLVLALLTVQRHMFRLASLWDDVRFPSDISRLSSQLDTIIMEPESTSQMYGTESVYSEPSDSEDTSANSKICSTDNIHSEPSDASDHPKDCCPPVESQVHDSGDIDDQPSGSPDSRGCEDCASLVCVCAVIKEEKQENINTFLLSGRPLTIEVWGHNVTSLSLQDTTLVVQEPAPVYEDIGRQEFNRNAVGIAECSESAPSGSESVWKFYDQDPLCYEDDLPAYWANILKYYVKRPFSAIPVPEWLLCNDSEKSASLGTSITSMTDALDFFIKSLLTFAHDTPSPKVKIEKLKAVVYKRAVRPKPIFTLNDLPQNHPQSIRSAMLAFFAHSCSLSYERRLIDVMVPALSGFLYVPGCRVSRSFPQPDALLEDVLESRVVVEGLPEIHWPSLIVAMPWDARPLQDGSSPLTKYFERSLRILTTLYSETPNPAVLPPWCVLIGIVYAATGFRVYAHYPLWDQDEDRWDYISVQLCKTHDSRFSESYIRDSCSAAYALLCIQRHAHEVQIQLRQSIREYGWVLQADLSA